MARQTMSRLLKLLALIAALTLFAAACGDDDPIDSADDEILFTITNDNMDQYADKLPEGIKAMLKAADRGVRVADITGRWATRD